MLNANKNSKFGMRAYRCKKSDGGCTMNRDTANAVKMLKYLYNENFKVDLSHIRTDEMHNERFYFIYGVINDMYSLMPEFKANMPEFVKGNITNLLADIANFDEHYEAGTYHDASGSDDDCPHEDKQDLFFHLLGKTNASHEKTLQVCDVGEPILVTFPHSVKKPQYAVEIAPSIIIAPILSYDTGKIREYKAYKEVHEGIYIQTFLKECCRPDGEQWFGKNITPTVMEYFLSTMVSKYDKVLFSKDKVTELITDDKILHPLCWNDIAYDNTADVPFDEFDADI